MIKTEVRDPAQIVTYTEAIETLQKTFIMTEAASGFETGDVFVWVYRTSDAFLDLVREHRPEALCILAYFSVLLRMLEHFVSSPAAFFCFTVLKSFDAGDDAERD